MPEYIMVVAACALIALQFSANKIFQRQCERRKSDVALYPMISGIFSFTIFAIYGYITGDFPGGFLASVKTLTFWMAFALAVISFLSMIIAVLAAKYGSTATYSVFMMLGSMIIGSVFAIIVWSEPAGLFKILGIITLIVSIIIPVLGKGEKMNLKCLIVCTIAGLLNGTYNVISTSHQKMGDTGLVADINSFMNWQYLLGTMLALVAYIVMRFILKVDKKGDSLPAQPEIVEQKSDSKGRLAVVFSSVAVLTVLSALMYSSSSGFGLLLQLIALETLDATIVTPLVSGISIVLSAVAGLLFFKEKPDKKTLIGIAVTLVGVAFIIIDALGVVPV